MNRFSFGCVCAITLAHSRRGFFLAVSLLATTTLSSPAGAVPLTDLLAGGSIAVGDCRFTDWQLVSLDATSTVPNLSLVSVHPLTNDLGAPGLQFVGNNQLAIAHMNGLDLVLKYRAEILPAGNTLEGHSLTITGVTFGSGGGVGFISNGLNTAFGAHLESTLVVGDPANGVFQFSDAREFSPQSSVLVTTNIFLHGITLGDSINLTTFNQRFLQTGPPILAGDYNQNGRVDALDYIVWRMHRGFTTPLPNDPHGGEIGESQFATWRASFGNTQTPGAGSSSAVPEPASLGVVGLATLIAAQLTRRRRNRR